MTTAEQNKIIEEVLDEVLGLGPLEPLLKEPSISDILVNGFDKVYVERAGKLSPSLLCASRTMRTFCISSKKSFPASAGVSMKRSRLWTRA